MIHPQKQVKCQFIPFVLLRIRNFFFCLACSTDLCQVANMLVDLYLVSTFGSKHLLFCQLCFRWFLNLHATLSYHKPRRRPRTPRRPAIVVLCHLLNSNRRAGRHTCPPRRGAGCETAGCNRAFSKWPPLPGSRLLLFPTQDTSIKLVPLTQVGHITKQLLSTAPIFHKRQ